ncbi:MAG: pyridoxal phosphate-dependent decarboxylase family protein, partial [Syntrophothermus sp.]
IDMSKEEFKQEGYKIVDWIAEYLNEIEKYPVIAQVKPGDIKKKLEDSVPVNGTSMDSIMEEFKRTIVPGLTHWNHPNFFALFNSTSSSAGIFGEFLSAALNVNGFLWKGSPSLTELEQKMMDWFIQAVGLPKNYWGIIFDSASTSTLHAIASAREQLNLNIRQKGMSGRTELPLLRIYSSEHSHSSVDKAALTLGLGLESLVKIKADEKFRMDIKCLKNTIAEDRAKGYLPMCVVGTIGTTSITSVDPIDEIAEVCERENLWLHVDAAYAGVTAMLEEKRKFFVGLDRADSIVMNPHKWFFTPVDISIYMTRKKEILKRAFSLLPEYLRTDIETENLMDYGFQLGRRFRALKLWFTFKYYGLDNLKNILREHIRLAEMFKSFIEDDKDFELMADVNFSTVCFRYKKENMTDAELDKLNEKLMNNLNDTGRIYLSHTKVNNKFMIRFVVSGLRQEERHITEAWKLIKEESGKI